MSVIAMIKRIWLGNRSRVMPEAISQEAIIKIHNDAHLYYQEDDLFYFESIEAFGAVKYDVVKEILHSEYFGVSPMHQALNRIYFQTDIEKHNHNKRAAINHLVFLSRKLQFQDSSYVNDLYQLMKHHLPKGKEIDLADQLINPITLVNALNDFGFLEVLTEFQPFNADFSYEKLIENSKRIFAERSHLEALLKARMNNHNIPPLIQKLLDDMGRVVEYEKSDLPLFYTTVIYTAIENTASFVGSLIYHILSKYPETLDLKDNKHQQILSLGNEVLRIYSPNFITFRTALKDITIRGVDFKEGSLVALFLGAANRDPQVFQDPMAIRWDRSKRHLAFGRGNIACIGQFAAFRMALNILENLSDDAKKIKVIEDTPQYVTQGVVRLSSFKVEYIE